MTQQLHNIRGDRFHSMSQVQDPITGTGPLVENERFETGRPSSNTWGVAARWLAFALMLIFAIIAMYWASEGRMQY